MMYPPIPEQFLADLAEALGHTREEDGAPLIMTPADTLTLVREMRDDAAWMEKRLERTEQLVQKLLPDPDQRAAVVSEWMETDDD